MIGKVLPAAGFALGIAMLSIPGGPCGAAPPTPAAEPSKNAEPVGKTANQDRPVPPPLKKAERLVQFELTEELEQGLLQPGSRVGLTMKLLGESGKLPGANLVAIVEGAGSNRTLISLVPGKDQGVLEARTSIELPASAEMGDSGGSGQGSGTAPLQTLRINVTFARLQGLKLEPLFKRRIYLALGHHAAEAPAGRSQAAAPGEIQIDTASASPQPEEEPPTMPIIDHAVTETDLVQGQAVSEDIRDYWRDLGRRIRDRWIERNPAITQEKTARAPRVSFRLYPGGLAQMIYLERSSGNARVDIASLESVLLTRPFPPFPAHMNESYVTVHVHFHGDRLIR